MGTKYSSQSTSGYNASPPADDGSQSASNLITWAGIKSKLADVLKTFGEAINTALVATLDLSARAISGADSAVAGDHWKTLQVTGTTTVTLGDAATLAAGWVTTVMNTGTGIVTIARTTSGDKINGVAQNLNLSPGDAVTLKVNAAADGFITDSARAVDLSRVNGRLTLSASTPITTGDVTSATVVRFTPYKGNKIALFDGTGTWNELAFAEKSLTVPAVADTPHDVFAYNDAGTVSIEATAWTNVSSRATALVLQDGVLVKSGATTRRYLGTFCTTLAGQVEDSLLNRYVWNYYNRVPRKMKKVEPANSWGWSTAAYQEANGTTNRLNFVIGVSEDPVTATATGAFTTSGATVRVAFTGIGLNVSNANSADVMDFGYNGSSATLITMTRATYKGYPGVGKHFLSWLEYGGGADTQTWFGDNNVAQAQTGILGEILA